MTFSEGAVEEVKSRIDLVDVVGEYLRLEKRGGSFVGLCPFHQEKSPSFTVSQEKQLFYCFGCGASGDLYHFVMKIENLPFPEAVRFLARRAGLVLPEKSSSAGGNQRGAHNEKLTGAVFSLNELALKYFHYVLCSTGEGEKALKYLLDRGIELSSVKSFKIGFAPAGWDGFLQVSLKKGYSKDLLVEGGLAVPRQSGSGYYDRFRNRIMFPIFDLLGRVIGFGGRILNEDEDKKSPKYLNSPRTVLFDKRRVLYGINLARDAIRERKKAVVVEGYTDVISAHHAGIQNTVASLGTALTSMQAHFLRSQAEDVIIAYDADTAGEAATQRGLDILFSSGCRVKVAEFPQGSDPDSYIRNHGKEAFSFLLDGAVSLIEYRLQRLKKKYNFDEMEGRLRFFEEALPVLMSTKNLLERDEYLRKLAEEAKVPEQVLRDEMKKYKYGRSGPGQSGNNLQINGKTNTVVEEDIDPAEKVLIGLLLTNEGVLELLENELNTDYFSPQVKNIINACNILKERGENIGINELLNYFSDESTHKMLTKLAFTGSSHGYPEKTVHRMAADCLRKLKINKLTTERNDIERKIKEMESRGVREEIRALLQRWEVLKLAERELVRFSYKEG